MSAANSAMDALENAIDDVMGSAFLVDQFITHGEHTDDVDRALHHVNRLLEADLKELRKAFDVAFHDAHGKNKGRK